MNRPNGPLFPGINMPPTQAEQVINMAVPVNDVQMVCMMAATIFAARIIEDEDYCVHDECVDDAVQLLARAIKRAQPKHIKAVLDTLPE